MRIIIVGGGTAGWLTAAACNHELRHADVTVIDKEISDPVAVGEATLLGFEKFLISKKYLLTLEIINSPSFLSFRLQKYESVDGELLVLHHFQYLSKLYNPFLLHLIDLTHMK